MGENMSNKTTTATTSSNDKISYEQLKETAVQLQQQVETFYKNWQQCLKLIQDRESAEYLQTVQFLFKVVENKDSFDTDFVSKCVNNIKFALTPIPQEEGCTDCPDPKL